MQVPRGRQTFSTEPHKNPPISTDLGGADTAITADWDRQETVCENVGVRDSSRMAVGECFSITYGAVAATMRRTKDTERLCHCSVSQHEVCSRCRSVSDKRLRFIPHVWHAADGELEAEQWYKGILVFLCYLFPGVTQICSLKWWESKRGFVEKY